jgi:uncharacterized protein (DUF2252 family)
MSESTSPLSAEDAGLLQPQVIRTLGLDTPTLTPVERERLGRTRREATPRALIGEWTPPGFRLDPVARLMAGNAGRDPALVPLRMSRMAVSPFTFLRGSASVMAADLATLPTSGLDVMLDGDAHMNNFGIFGTPDAQIVVDLNDFDEVLIGPWEWDLKRLTASIEVAGREIGLDASQRSHAVRGAVAGYRTMMHRSATMPVLTLWQRRTTVAELVVDVPPEWAPDAKVDALLGKAEEKARQSDNAALLQRMSRHDESEGRRFIEEPPVLTRPDAATRERVAEGLHDYLETLSPERRFMLQRYAVADVAHRVVGVGSVGLRAWCVMLFGNDGSDPLFLQVKQAAPAVHAAYAGKQPPELSMHEGRRVVYGQRLMQALGDPLLGWTTIDGLPYYVRQMRNLKGSIAPEKLSPPTFSAFCWSYGGLLARAHARTGDAAAIAGYCGSDSGQQLDEALLRWSISYADQTEADHARLVAAIAKGEVPSMPASQGDSGE